MNEFVTTSESRTVTAHEIFNNNVIVTNLVHIISNNEADNMQIARILIGQLLSFCLVMIWYRKIRILKYTTKPSKSRIFIGFSEILNQ